MKAYFANVISRIKSHYAGNKRMWQFGFVFIIACIIHNYPGLLIFLPEDLRHDIQTAAYQIISYGVGVLAFMSKQFNTSGNGSAEKPYIKPENNDPVT